MTQFFCRWRGAKWQTGFTGTLLFPVQVFRESEHARNTWRLIMLLSCSTVNILPTCTDDMTFAIHFTSIYACFLNTCLRLSFSAFSRLPLNPVCHGNRAQFMKSPCFHSALFGVAAFHTFTQGFQTEASYGDKDWSNLKPVNTGEPCWGWIFEEFDWTPLSLNNSCKVIIHLVPCFSIDSSSFCGQNLERYALLLWLKL